MKKKCGLSSYKKIYKLKNSCETNKKNNLWPPGDLLKIR